RIVDAATDDLRWVLPNASGVEYGLFLLDEASLAYLGEHLPSLEPALARGAAWVTLWDQVLEGRFPPDRLLDLAVEALPRETDELVLGRVLGDLGGAYWDLVPPEIRAARAAEIEAVLWDGVAGERPATARAAFFSTWRTMATTREAVDRM